MKYLQNKEWKPYFDSRWCSCLRSILQNNLCPYLLSDSRGVDRLMSRTYRLLRQTYNIPVLLVWCGEHAGSSRQSIRVTAWLGPVWDLCQPTTVHIVFVVVACEVGRGAKYYWTKCNMSLPVSSVEWERLENKVTPIRCIASLTIYTRHATFPAGEVVLCCIYYLWSVTVVALVVAYTRFSVPYKVHRDCRFVLLLRLR